MTPLGRIFYGAVLLGFAAIVPLGLLLGELALAALAVGFGAVFSVTAPFVLGRRWRAPPPRSPYPRARRRPVRRRRP